MQAHDAKTRQRLADFEQRNPYQKESHHGMSHEMEVAYKVYGGAPMSRVASIESTRAWVPGARGWRKAGRRLGVGESGERTFPCQQITTSYPFRGRA